jgi:hypothetical protein
VLVLALGNQVVFQEKFYAADGVNRTFVVN